MSKKESIKEIKDTVVRINKIFDEKVAFQTEDISKLADQFKRLSKSPLISESNEEEATVRKQKRRIDKRPENPGGAYQYERVISSSSSSANYQESDLEEIAMRNFIEKKKKNLKQLKQNYDKYQKEFSSSHNQENSENHTFELSYSQNTKYESGNDSSKVMIPQDLGVSEVKKKINSSSIRNETPIKKKSSSHSQQ